MIPVQVSASAVTYSEAVADGQQNADLDIDADVEGFTVSSLESRAAFLHFYIVV